MIVYTAHIGDTDPLLAPQTIEEGVRYFCFTDRKDLKSDIWRIIYAESEERDPRWSARQLKILTPIFWNEPVTIWIDGTNQLKMRPSDIVKNYLEGYHMLAMAHPHRDNITEEGEVITKEHGIDTRSVSDQISEYRHKGFDPHHQRSLTTTGLLVRRHTETTNKFCQLWWKEMLKHNHPRDQMSVDFCAAMAGVRIGYLYGHYRNNKYAQWWPHGGCGPASRMKISRCQASGRKFVNAKP